MKKTKILLFIENSSFGGGEKVFGTLAAGLRAAGFEVFCASRPEGRFYEMMKDICTFIPADISSLYGFLRCIPRLRKLIKQEGIALIHTQGARADFAGFCVCACTRTKLVAEVAMLPGNFNVSAFRRKIYHMLHRLVLRRAVGIVVVSRSLEDDIKRGYGLAGGTVFVIRNFVDGSVFNPGRFKKEELSFLKRHGLAGKTVVGAIGRLEWQKGFETLIKAMNLVNPGRFSEKPVLLIAGSGSLRNRLEKLSAELGLEKSVFLCGEIKNPEEFLAALDIFVMPSLLEGQPLALLEAMAMGKPIAASRIEAVTEILPEDSAVFFEKGDEKALARALEKLLDDIQLREKIGARAFQIASGYSIDNFMKEHLAVYKRILGE